MYDIAKTIGSDIQSWLTSLLQGHPLSQHFVCKWDGCHLLVATHWSIIMSYSTRCLKNKVSHFARRRTADSLLEIKSEILPIDYFINKKFESSQLSNIYRISSSETSSTSYVVNQKWEVGTLIIRLLYERAYE